MLHPHCSICDAPSRVATSTCMPILHLRGSDASYSYNYQPLTTPHYWNSSSVPPEHIARRSVLQVRHRILKNAARCARASRARSKVRSSPLRLATVFSCRATARLALRNQMLRSRQAVQRGPRWTKERDAVTTKMKLQNDRSAMFKCTKTVIHPLQPSCDAQDAAICWQVDQMGHTSQQYSPHKGAAVLRC